LKPSAPEAAETRAAKQSGSVDFMDGETGVGGRLKTAAGPPG
jgi:hypothetical protein